MVGLLVAFAVISTVIGDRFGVSGSAFVNQFVRAAAALTVLVVWSRHVDRRSIRDYGFNLDRSWGLDFLAGVGIAILVHSGALITLISAGWVRIDGWFSAGAEPFLIGILLYGSSRVFVAIWEETIFRALFLRNAAEGFAGWFTPQRAVLSAWVVSSVTFGVIHLNQAPTPVALSFWILLGLVLGVAYGFTGELGLPVGFHFAYNFAAINLFNVVAADPSLAEETGQLATVIRLVPEGGPTAFVGIAGWINVTWAIVGGLLTIAYASWRYGFGWEESLARWSRMGHPER